MQNTKMYTPAKQTKKTTGVLNNSSPRSMNNSVSGVPSSILVGGRNSILKRLERGHNRTPRKTARMLGSDGKEINPLAMFQAELGVVPSSAGRFFLGETFFSSGSDHMKSTSSFTVHSSSSFVGSSLQSNMSAIASLTNESEDSSQKLDIPINPPEVLKENDNIEQTVTEEMLDEVAEICLTETDTISLLDIPSSIFVTEDADDAGVIKEKNNQYAELCKNRIGNDNYLEESAQTFSGAPKDKHTQSDKIAKEDKGMIATTWDIYDSFFDQNKSPDNDKDDYTESSVGTSKDQEKSGEKSGSSSSYTVATDSTDRGSLFELEMCGRSLNTELDPQLILSESFRHSLFVMERIVVGKIFQPKLAAYRQLPILKDPDSTAKPGTEEQSEEGEESASSPSLEYLWAFSCELTKGCNITSMAWNKINPNILAVAYGDFDLSNCKPSLICCWSLKNPMWPERVFHCDSWVTSLDFSAINPSQLAVGMYDGTLAIYDVQRQNNNARIADSSKCSERHLHPVWQVNWIKEETLFLREGGAEALISVSADGRITMWSLLNNGLGGRDLMELKSTQNTKKKRKAAGTKTKTECFLSVLTRGLCLDIHPTDSCIYLVGTSEGLIHKCSLSNSQNVLETYQKDLCPVNHIEWSPFSSDVFLSCSSDQIQLWKQDYFTPVFSFTSTQEVVKTIRWSPNWPTIFAAIIGRQLEIWDLDSNILAPTIVHHAAPGVKLMSLLFTTGTDCVFLGDSDGQITVYQLKNLSVGKGEKVETLDDVIQHI
ncbi:WD repeat-containing protein 78-like isoform X2 [Sparus aurata]|uniref:WD repeat-containing protein 78-like isoform X2 n=1 Tax=Sparus aurata TaxID=8175 RepID=UPI0011C1CE02|nr:WD repeat-containing protein 78-like isoform X2 [Sparus aurata]